MDEKKRDIWADYMKGICVIFIVLGHSYIPTSFMKYFFVPIFWIVTGYYFKKKTISEYFVIRGKRIYYPFVAVNILYIVLRNVNFYIGLSSASYKMEELPILLLRVFLLDVPDELASPMWFLSAIFLGELIYLIISIYIHNNTLKFIIVLSLYLLQSCIPEMNNIIWGNCSIASLCLLIPIFIFGGEYIKKSNLLEFFKGKKTKVIVCIIFAFLFALIQKEGNYKVDYRSAYTNNFIVLLVLPYIGFIFLYCLIEIIYKRILILDKIIIRYGYKSIYVLAFHPLGFMVIGLLQIHIFDRKIEEIDIWQNYIPGGKWNYCAAVVALLLPIIIVKILDGVKFCYKKISIDKL